jgi:hypothetical protein
MPSAWGGGGLGQIQWVSPGSAGVAPGATRFANALETAVPHERYRCPDDRVPWPLKPLYRIQTSFWGQHGLTPDAATGGVLAAGVPVVSRMKTLYAR